MTERARYTPGPWKIFDGWGADPNKPIVVDSLPDVDGKCVANCICYLSTTNPDYEPNARLIAAAPELAECLRKLHDLDKVSPWKPETWTTWNEFMDEAAALLNRVGA